MALVEGDARVIDALAPLPSAPEAPVRARRVSGRVLAIVAGVLVVALVAGAVVARSRMTPSLTVVGPAQGAQIGAAAVGGLTFSAPGEQTTLRNERWTFDGRNVTRFVVAADGKLVFRPSGLNDGAHELDVSLGGGFLGATAHRHFAFDVDLTPPDLSVAPVATGMSWHPVEIRGTVGEGPRCGSTGGRLRSTDGEFFVRLQPPVPALVPVVATDVAGNTTVDDVTVTLSPSAAVGRGAGGARHGGGLGRSRPCASGVMALVAEHRINTIELDLKDEGGRRRLRRRSRSADRDRRRRSTIYDLAAAVADAARARACA